MSKRKLASAYEDSLIHSTDDRDAVQKKTFTKWINKHLVKCNEMVGDLFVDLRNGHSLITLLEILAQERLPRERGNTRFHKIHNVQIALDFLRHKRIRLVNIGADEIVDGNTKLTLGLVWTIILHFQISDVLVSERDSSVSAREALLVWSRRMVAGYPGVRINDFTHSWRDGLAFLAILHRNRPDLVDYRQARQQSARQNLDMAFNIFEREFGITRLLDPEDVDVAEPDEKSVITYVSSLYEAFPDVPSMEQSHRDTETQAKWEEYEEIASSLVDWLQVVTPRMLVRNLPTTYDELKIYASDFNRFRMEEVPRHLKDKYRLTTLHEELKDLRGSPHLMGLIIDNELRIENINRLWEDFSRAQNEKSAFINDRLARLNLSR